MAEPRRFPLALRVVAGVVVGVAAGVAFGRAPIVGGLTTADLGPVGLLVIRLLKALATPLILVAILDSFLKTAVSARSGLRLAAVCVANVTVAMTLGLALLNGLAPGRSWEGHLVELGLVAHGAAKAPPAEATLSPLANLAGFVPESVVAPFADNAVISVVLLAVLAGASLRAVRERGEHAEGVRVIAGAVEAAYATITTMLLGVAELMPFAVALIIADVVGKAGIAVFETLWVFLAVLLAGLLTHALVYYPLSVWLVGRRSPVAYLRGALDAVVTAVSSNSSLATMPVTLRCLRDLGVREEAARLSACVGTNFNNDGIMLYEAMATLFLCQALGQPLGLVTQLTVVVSAVMAGVGIAGVPEAGLVILPLVLDAAGVPDAAIAVAIPLVVPVDWILARVRSGVNVLADMQVAILLDRFEGPADGN